MRLGGIYFDPVVIRTNYDADTITVLAAPPLTAITPELYDQACTGEASKWLQAGEGLFAIYADNGTFRYRLTGDFESVSYALLAEKFAGPSVDSAAS